MVNVNVTGGEMSQAEINSYIDRARSFTLKRLSRLST